MPAIEALGLTDKDNAALQLGELIPTQQTA